MKKIKITVLFGGRSAEREISIRTGKQIIEHLDQEKYIVTLLEIPKTGNAWVAKLVASKPTVAFIALHGPFGEDGTIQGMLEMLGIPYTCSGVLASALALDKFRLLELMRAQGIKTPKGILLTRSDIRRVIREIGFPCIVKPNRLGSSVGITVNIQNERDLQAALNLNFRYDPEALVEEYIKGREITASVLGNTKPRALPLIEIVAKIGSFYNYDSKYVDGGSDHLIPAPLPRTLTEIIQSIAIHAHNAIGARGVTRSDFIARGTTPYFLEINTIPGMTKTSLVPQAAVAAGISFTALLNRLIDSALAN